MSTFCWPGNHGPSLDAFICKCSRYLVVTGAEWYLLQEGRNLASIQCLGFVILLCTALLCPCVKLRLHCSSQALVLVNLHVTFALDIQLIACTLHTRLCIISINRRLDAICASLQPMGLASESQLAALHATVNELVYGKVTNWKTIICLQKL